MVDPTERRVIFAEPVDFEDDEEEGEEEQDPLDEDDIADDMPVKK